jgi:hypothetical protein
MAMPEIVADFFFSRFNCMKIRHTCFRSTKYVLGMSASMCLLYLCRPQWSCEEQIANLGSPTACLSRI